MKTCIICENHFSLNGERGGQNRQICYDCLPKGLTRPERNSLRRKLITEKVNQYKLSKGCSVCGYHKCGAALEFHHPNGDKDFNIADRARHGNHIDEIFNEIDKCIILCANCHREIHNNSGSSEIV